MKIEKILVADDEEPIYNYLQRKLSKLGYTVAVAKDGEETLRKAFSIIPDIILLDVKMPRLNGLDVCRRLKADERTKGTPVIMLSAKAQNKEKAEGLEAGADRYLCKPIGFPDIVNEIRGFENR
jgi:two-component system, OmpR family, phosphate regulon response regulator PhoB